MVKEDLIKSGSLATVTALCKEAVRQALGYSAVHVGINTENEEEARKAAVFFESTFGFPPLETGKSFFAGDELEIMKFPGQGRNGHIAIGVNNVALARAHLERAGLTFKEESATFTCEGRLTLIYLSAEIAGFAIHLVQKKEKAA
jgi:2-dehydro-3-deoxyphosphogluconate aldolase/(4S)-4-hydroxy-2-oxoglutarate aldolase